MTGWTISLKVPGVIYYLSRPEHWEEKEREKERRKRKYFEGKKERGEGEEKEGEGGVREMDWEMRTIGREELNEIILSQRMFNDHFPWVYEAAIKNLYSRYVLEKKEEEQ
eukprot:TRINITY_DN3207_c0_g1_i2.p1 TRINITY_DN3207_c0_g1~~TRINITY_DN3207_c0_g1_i2.p1  ORF type:complete len:120 (-),score=65.17 TRINITY_DN3207_c0_g1_i2:30-359(-)